MQEMEIGNERMRAEIIAIGDELSSGVRLDTNSQWLSQRLEQAGVRVWYHTTVGDDMDAIVSVVRTALERTDVVVVSGGLGPTADDLTRQALATVADCPLVRNSDVLEHIRNLFARRGREMPQRNEVQAEFPAGSDVIVNPFGTAPGIHIAAPRGDAGRTCQIYALPGVPAELKQMWTDSVEPEVIAMLGGNRRVIRHRSIRCFGAGESDIEQRLPDLVRRGRKPSVGITASRATISLRVTADGTTSEECFAAMEPTVATIYECLGTLVYGEGDDELQDVVNRLLEQQQMRLSTAEWGTQGLLARWLASASQTGFCGGVVIGNGTALGDFLGIKEPVDDTDPASVAHVVGKMATQVRDTLQADLGLAVGPVPATFHR